MLSETEFYWSFHLAFKEVWCPLSHFVSFPSPWPTVFIFHISCFLHFLFFKLTSLSTSCDGHQGELWDTTHTWGSLSASLPFLFFIIGIIQFSPNCSVCASSDPDQSTLYLISLYPSTEIPVISFCLWASASFSLDALIIHRELMQMFLQGALLPARSQPHEPQLPHVGRRQASPGSFPHGKSIARWGLWQEILPFNSPLVCPLVNKGCTHLPSTWKTFFAKGCFIASSDPHKPSKLSKAEQLNLLVHVVL